MSQSAETNGDLQDGDGVDIGKKHKIGHLRVDTQGNATFKRLPTNQLVDALQLGIQYSVGGLEAKQAHDVLFQDFQTVEIIHFPKDGRQTPKATPPHRFNDFTIRSYAPVAFRHFREKFNLRPEDFLSSICRPLRELKNPGASGSLFYLTSDDQFILKTVQRKEAAFLKTLLPGYYLNMTQNPRTLLPKFFGLYCYQATEFLPRNKRGAGENKNIRITVMNNLIPSHVQMHEKYDLKGSTYKRRANSGERQKESPTWKDLDFMERHPNGLFLDVETYNALKKTVLRDCRVLESFQIMDYSFLIGVHQVDPLSESGGDRAVASISFSNASSTETKRMMYSTPMDNIQAHFDEYNKPDDDLAKTGGIPARTSDGQKLSLYVGIIDILQSYQIRKKLEHTFKSVVTDGTQISVTNPSFYSERFQKFLFSIVFKKAPQSPTKLPENPLKPVIPRVPKLPTDITPTIRRLHDKPKRMQPHVMNTNSFSSTGTSNSRITSYYDSLRSSKQSLERNNDDSSATLYGSSRQSDSLFQEPRKDKSAKILTTSFRGPRQIVDQNSSTSPETRQILLPIGGGIVGKAASSTTNLSYRPEYSPINRQQNHRSSDQITRL